MLRLNINKYRILSHMSQETLAEKTNRSQTYISELEKGDLRKKSPTLKTIHLICKALNVCIHKIIVCDCHECKAKRGEL